MKILLAVSGGIDSMYMAKRAPELFPGASFAIAHCNFSLRGEESDDDQAFVEQWCRSEGLECYAKRFDTIAYAKQKGISTEMAARDLRYNWFAQLAKDEGFDAVAVAHNANDNAETLILNLLRGTGTKGMRGMSERYISYNSGVKVLRPLLSTTRAEIQAWVAANAVPYREDSTNAGNEFKRNKIRNLIFPIFEEINPSYISALSGDMRHFAQVDDIADDYFENMGMGVFVPGQEDAISISALLRTDHWEYILFRILDPYGFDEDILENIITLLGSNGTISGKTFEAPAWKVVTGSDRLMILPREQSSDDATLTITEPGEYLFKGQIIKVEELQRDSDLSLKQPSGILIADAAKLGFPFVLRGWNAGDWMHPLGLHGKKKLSDLFVDLKWSLPQKDKAIVMSKSAEDDHALALLCERIDDTLKVDGNTKKIIRITADTQSI